MNDMVYSLKLFDDAKQFVMDRIRQLEYCCFAH